MRLGHGADLQAKHNHSTKIWAHQRIKLPKIKHPEQERAQPRKIEEVLILSDHALLIDRAHCFSKQIEIEVGW
jgi:hypothetical protein